MSLAFFFRPPNRGWRFCRSKLGGQSWNSWWRWGWHPVPFPESVRIPGTNLQEEWVAGISVTLNTHPTPAAAFGPPSSWGDCGWREGERGWIHYRPFLKAACGGVGGLSRVMLLGDNCAPALSLCSSVQHSPTLMTGAPPPHVMEEKDRETYLLRLQGPL